MDPFLPHQAPPPPSPPPPLSPPPPHPHLFPTLAPPSSSVSPPPPLAPPSPPPPPQINPEEFHISQVATASPPKHVPNHLNHPPYAEMIITAINSLNEKKGSSRKAIAKFIDSNYTNLPQSHSALLTHHLKRLKKNGNVLAMKNSYKLPKSTHSSVTTTTTTGKESSVSDGLLLPKRGRGRPPKTTDSTILVPDESVVLPKKGRGRPPMSMSKSKPKPIERGGPRPRGRPRKENSDSGSVLVPRMVMFPREQKRVTTTGRPVGRPRKIILESSAAAVVSGNGGSVMRPVISSTGRPVGRPRKFSGVVNPKSVSNGGQIGRPRKVGGGIVKKPARVSTGRPVGRPRKGHNLKERVVKLLEEALNLGLNQDVPTMLQRFKELYNIITGSEYSHAVGTTQGTS